MKLPHETLEETLIAGIIPDGSALSYGALGDERRTSLGVWLPFRSSVAENVMIFTGYHHDTHGT
jgi:hypothetical protein